MSDAVSTAGAAEMSPGLSELSVKQALTGFADTMTGTLEALLPLPAGPEGKLYDAMRYSALGSGKVHPALYRPHIGADIRRPRNPLPARGRGGSKWSMPIR